MKPAICPVCGNSAVSAAGDFVEFADYQPVPTEQLGDAKGREWFCAAHLQAAQSLSNMALDEALKTLR